MPATPHEHDASAAPRRPIQRRPIQRRTLAKGVAWSVPAVAVTAAAPAFAASPKPPCLPSARKTAAFSTYNFTRRSLTTSGASFTGQAVNSLGSPVFEVTGTTTTYNRTELATSLSNTEDAVVHFSEHGQGPFSGLNYPIPITNAWTASKTGKVDWIGNYANRQTTCITFTRPVYNLQFQVGDIDSYYGTNGNFQSTRYRDAVALTATYVDGTTSGPTSTVTRNSVVGDGLPANPYRRADSYIPNQHDPWTSTAGTVTAGFAAKLGNGDDKGVTSVCADYWSGEGGGLQVVLLRASSFTYCP